jgi:hypothetical protein
MEAGIIKAAGTKKPAVFKADAIDADGDGMVQDGTIFERPATKVVEAEVSDEL